MGSDNSKTRQGVKRDESSGSDAVPVCQVGALCRQQLHQNLSCSHHSTLIKVYVTHRYENTHYELCVLQNVHNMNCVKM